MIVYKFWEKKLSAWRTQVWEGWYLFGFIPLYVRLVKDITR
jgi:hypothetical protein